MPQSTFTYSKEVVQRRLEALSSRSRVAFGLSCSERMLRNYVAFKQKVKWGDERPLQQALDELWKYAEGQVLDESTAKRLLAACEVVTPDSDDFSELLTGAAQEACFSICCVLDYVQQKNPERIAQASAFAIDTLDLYISALLNGFSTTPRGIFNRAEHEEQIRLHPLMQRELARQDTDLKLLATNPSLGSLKARWRAPAKSNIDL
ncbi:MAG: DUF416 family protein [Verrucomicrobiota bacterium]|jgi:hypothetical protein